MLRLYLYARVRLLLFFCTRDRGCSKHPAFPAPSFGRKIFQQLGRITPRGRELTRAPSLRAQRSNPFFSFFSWRDGLLRGACHRARIRATRWLAMTVVDASD